MLLSLLKFDPLLLVNYCCQIATSLRDPVGLTPPKTRNACIETRTQKESSKVVKEQQLQYSGMISGSKLVDQTSITKNFPIL